AACALRGIVRGRNAGAALARQNNLVTRTAEEICPARAGKRDVHGGAAGNRDRPLFDPKWLRWIQESAVVLIFFDNSWWRARVDRRAGQQRRAQKRWSALRDANERALQLRRRVLIGNQEVRALAVHSAGNQTVRSWRILPGARHVDRERIPDISGNVSDRHRAHDRSNTGRNDQRTDRHSSAAIDRRIQVFNRQRVSVAVNSARYDLREEPIVRVWADNVGEIEFFPYRRIVHVDVAVHDRRRTVRYVYVRENLPTGRNGRIAAAIRALDVLEREPLDDDG